MTPEGDVYPCHSLDGPRFLCGNVRRDAMPAIVDRLSHLAATPAPDLAGPPGCVCPT